MLRNLIFRRALAVVGYRAKPVHTFVPQVWESRAGEARLYLSDIRNQEGVDPEFTSMTTTRETAHSRPSTFDIIYADVTDEEGGVDLEFTEEPLGLTAEYGFGYADLAFHDKVGPQGRYEVLRKLGYGLNASVWLAKDAQTSSFVALKVLTTHAFRQVLQGACKELEVMHALSLPLVPRDESHVLSLVDYFEKPVEECGQRRAHLCLVTDLAGGIVSTMRRTYRTDNALPIPLAKRVLHHVLLGLAFSHDRGVVHTDLKPDNIVFGLRNATNVDECLALDPPRRHAPEPSWPPGTMVEPAVSQPFPLPSLEEALELPYFVADWGSAQFYAKPDTSEISPELLRAPESILRGFWDHRVDIWSFGCLAFELLTGENLFFRNPPTSKRLSISGERLHLYQMMVYSGEAFSPQQLQESDQSRVAEYFPPTGGFLEKVAYPHRRRVWTLFHEVVSDNARQDPAEGKSAAALIEKCLRLNPRERPTARDLLDDPWWQS